jgi:hypothetical protein
MNIYQYMIMFGVLEIGECVVELVDDESRQGV